MGKSIVKEDESPVRAIVAAKEFIKRLAVDAGLRDEQSYRGIADAFYLARRKPYFEELASAFDKTGRIMQTELSLPAKARIDIGYDRFVQRVEREEAEAKTRTRGKV